MSALIFVQIKKGVCWSISLVDFFSSVGSPSRTQQRKRGLPWAMGAPVLHRHVRDGALEHVHLSLLHTLMRTGTPNCFSSMPLSGGVAAFDAAFVNTLLSSIESLSSPPCPHQFVELLVLAAHLQPLQALQSVFLSINGSGVRPSENCIQTATSQTAGRRQRLQFCPHDLM